MAQYVNSVWDVHRSRDGARCSSPDHKSRSLRPSYQYSSEIRSSRSALSTLPSHLLFLTVKGVSRRPLLCETCGDDVNTCPGHFGFIEFHLPVFHVGFLKYIYVLISYSLLPSPPLTFQKYLWMICKSCGRILLDSKERARFRRKLRNPSVQYADRMEVRQDILKATKKVFFASSHACHRLHDVPHQDRTVVPNRRVSGAAVRTVTLSSRHQ